MLYNRDDKDAANDIAVLEDTMKVINNGVSKELVWVYFEDPFSDVLLTTIISCAATIQYGIHSRSLESERAEYVSPTEAPSRPQVFDIRGSANTGDRTSPNVRRSGKGWDNGTQSPFLDSEQCVGYRDGRRQTANHVADSI